MEATSKMDEMKRKKRLKTALLSQKMQQVLAQLENLEEEVYINGGAEALRDYCVVTRASVKFKGADYEQPKEN